MVWIHISDVESGDNRFATEFLQKKVFLLDQLRFLETHLVCQLVHLRKHLSLDFIGISLDNFACRIDIREVVFFGTIILANSAAVLQMVLEAYAVFSLADTVV